MYKKVLSLVALLRTAQAHLSLWYPPPLGGAREANPLSTKVDKHMNFPFGCCDSKGGPTLPSPGDCRGHLDLLDTEEGRPQVIWEPGQDAYFQLSDYTYTIGVPGSTHYGGSCQIGFSIDRGQTWKVAASYHGNCPHRTKDGSPDSQTFNFRVPTNMPSGLAIFAWVWLNREHESFMNCASVQIGSTPSQPQNLSWPATQMTLISNTQTQGVENPTSTARGGGYVKHRHSRKHPKFHIRGEAIPQHRHLIHTRAVEACDWNSAPTMETSYYTSDAKCAASAKVNKPESDRFEIGWADACGIVHGDNAYPIENLKC